jgi:hypothetical protein
MITARSSLSQAAFAARVDNLVKAAIVDGATGFAALLHRLPGVYPTEVLVSLDRLLDANAIDPAAAASIRRQAAAKGAAVAEGRSLLPLPHPLDYEWRFTPDSARLLLNRAVDMTHMGGDLLLFGTPGLAVEALTLPVSRRVAFLAESNSLTDRVLALNRVTGAPLLIAFCSGGLPRESADAVLLDPPWYLDFVRPMLAAAAHACRPEGIVLISLPPDGARPRAEADRQAAIAFARRLGFTLVEHSSLAISYETPFFERNALAAAGIHPPAQWRRGDLVVLRKARASTRPAPASSGRRRLWTEVGIGRMRLFIRGADEVRSDEPGLISLVDDDVLPTVSRRDPRRRLANVWTSGNRIFRTHNPLLLLEAAISCAGEVMGSGVQPGLWGTIREREALERVAAELRTLAAIEEQEEGQTPTVKTDRSVSCRSSLTNYGSKSTAIISG